MKLPKKVKNKPYGTQNGRALLRKWEFAALDQILSAQKINASRQTDVACIKRPRLCPFASFPNHSEISQSIH